MTRGEIAKHNAYQALVSMDQALYNFCGALWALLACVLRTMPTGRTWADESLSSRAYRWEQNGVRSWPRRLIDRLFFWEQDHCYQSYISEREGRQLPPELR